MIGIVILIAYGLLLGVIYFIQRRRKRIKRNSTNNMIFADGKVKTSTLTLSVFASWMWVTSIFGSAETFDIYGIWGPVGYVLGACLAFFFFVIVMTRIKKAMPSAATYLSYLGQRYNRRTKLFYFIFAFLVAAYVLIEQAVGVAYVLERLFGTSFKWVAFLSVIIAVVFVINGGMRALLTNEVIIAIVVLVGFFATVVYLTANGESTVKMIASTDKGPWIEQVVLVSAVKYFLLATIIAFSQLLFDPAYYIKATLAKGRKQLKKAYLLGGIAIWGSLSFVTSAYLGWAAAYAEEQPIDLFGGVSRVIFAVLIVFIGVSTVCHYLMGMFGIFTVEYYREMLRPEASERQMLTFGRLMTVSIGLFCALTAISLENISLLTIDVFCAIFFASPCGVLLMGIFTKGKYSGFTIFSTVTGVAAGLSVWIFVPTDGQWDQILGALTAFILPTIVMVTVNSLDRMRKVC